MAESSVLPREGVRLGLTAADKWDAIRQCGAVLTELGAVEDGYPDAMLEREKSVSTFIGEGGTARPSTSAWPSPRRATST